MLFSRSGSVCTALKPRQCNGHYCLYFLSPLLFYQKVSWGPEILHGHQCHKSSGSPFSDTMLYLGEHNFKSVTKILRFHIKTCQASTIFVGTTFKRLTYPPESEDLFFRSSRRCLKVTLQIRTLRFFGSCQWGDKQLCQGARTPIGCEQKLLKIIII